MVEEVHKVRQPRGWATCISDRIIMHGGVQGKQLAAPRPGLPRAAAPSLCPATPNSPLPAPSTCWQVWEVRSSEVDIAVTPSSNKV